MSLRRWRGMIDLLINVFLLNALAAVPVLVIFYYFAFPNFEPKLVQARKDGARAIVDAAFNVLVEYDAKVKRGELTIEAAKSRAASLVAKLRHGDIGYFFIYNLKKEIVINPAFPEVIPADSTDPKAAAGRKIVETIVGRAQREDMGYYEYLWPKPGSSQFRRKITRFRFLKDWGWVLAYGVYVDDIEQEMFDFKLRLFVSLFFSAILSVLISVQVFRTVRPDSGIMG